MSGPPPKKDRVRRAAPKSGEWIAPDAWGWREDRFGPRPTLAVDGPCSATVQAWEAWLSSWWAAFWTPGDLPQLQLAASLLDQHHRGQLDISKLTPVLDKLGITPKGRQDLRWSAPKEEEAPKAGAKPEGGRYGHLRTVSA